MKKYIVIIFSVFVFGNLFSQTRGISYQALIINPEDEEAPGFNGKQVPLSNKEVCLRFSFLDSSDKVEYQEIQKIKTDEFGMVNLFIGQGVGTGAGYVNVFNEILWDGSTKRLKVEVDVKYNCQVFEEISNQILAYVPFAFYALNSPASKIPGPKGDTGIGIKEIKNISDTLIVKLSNDSILNFGSIKGAKGDKGEKGDQGQKGDAGIQGKQGIDGVGILKVQVNNDSLFLTLTDSTIRNAGYVKGDKGDNGNGFQNGNIVNQMIYWNGTSWSLLNPGVNGQVLAICNGSLGWETLNGICPGLITSFSCNTATHNGTLTTGVTASAVTSTISYTGGNGGSYSTQIVSSTGVTGLTATLSAGALLNGNGSVSYTITGTPSVAGTASFLINLGGQSCSFSISVAVASTYPAGSVFCASGPTAIVDVTNPATGKTWMDRNLGASRVAISSTDTVAYGDLYQWGRRSDGHQCRNSATTTSTLSSIDQPAHGSFILTSSPNDWRNPQNTNLWQGISGINNPCPSGYRLPTEIEINDERLSWSSNNSAGAFASQLKLPMAGSRSYNSSSIGSVGITGLYWSSSVSSAQSLSLGFYSAGAGIGNNMRASGFSVRCIKDIVGIVGAINCGSNTNTGTLTAGTAASGVSSSIPYTGGNGGTYNSQSISSTGVTGLTATLSAGTFTNGTGSLLYTITGTPSSSGTASFALNIGGQSCTLNLTVSIPIGTISSLSCGSVTTTGSLTVGVLASGVSSSIPYTGGNGGTYNSQSISSTGVTGLTATLSAGTLLNGNGSVSYTITGTPSVAGTASFLINLGGQSCSFSISVAAASTYPAGSVFCASGPTAIVDVTNPATGKTWMDRNLGASRAATSSTDTAAYGDLYQWGRRSDGHQCRNSATTTTLSSTDQPGNDSLILAPNLPYDWRSPQNSNLWQGVNGINNPCPSGYRLPTEIELNAERLSWIQNIAQNNSVGAFTSPLKLVVAGYRNGRDNGAVQFIDSFGLYSSSTSIIGQLSSAFKNLVFSINYANINNPSNVTAMSVRCIKDIAVTVGSVGSINCSSLSITGALITGTPASNVSVSVPYTGGNGGSYSAQIVSSTGVTGLTATLNAGTLLNGNGSVSYMITGTSTVSGTASFLINLGGQSCSFTLNVASTYSSGSVFCASGATAVVDVFNPTTGKAWMDRNLGASRAATSSTDTAAYGDLYQWGRRSDGHQCRNSSVTITLSSTDQPPHGSFIYAPNPPEDWRSPQNTNLWQGGNGVNSPCPSGYRLPTEIELNAERLSWSQNNGVGAFTSPLKLPMAGGRGSGSSGSLFWVGSWGNYWSSSILIDINVPTSGSSSRALTFNSSSASMANTSRSIAWSLRCIKETTSNSATIGSLNCGSSTITGSLIAGTSASNVSISVPYTGGNGGTYNGQAISSTGVTGLTVTLSAGTLLNGNGSVSYTITGTPSATGTATFAITLGGQSCNLTVSVAPAIGTYPVGSIFCASGATAVVDVTNPATGKTWMDRNLGATQAALSSTDANSYGDLYQWGRRNDGHQCRNSATTSTLSPIDQPAHGNFILSNSSPRDWRSPQNANLWQGVNGVNNPCPSGYRLPTEYELDAERTSWGISNSVGAFASPLKFSMAGFRGNILNVQLGALIHVGTSGNYWSSTGNGTNSRGMIFDGSIRASNLQSFNDRYRADGFSVRCIKN
jgi:uncharacterized protein (TIGR02145 family)